MTIKRACLGAALLLAVSAATWAGNGVDAATVTLYPTFKNLGVEVQRQGDANGNASGAVFYRVTGQGTWKEGHPLVLVGDSPVDPKTNQTTNLRFYSSISCLSGEHRLW